MTFPVYASDLIEENKWRAVRWGAWRQADRLRQKEEMPTIGAHPRADQWFLDDMLDELGTRKEVEYAYRILEEGSSAQRQFGHLCPHG